MYKLSYIIKNQINQIEFKVCFGILLMLQLGGFVYLCYFGYGGSNELTRNAAFNHIIQSPDLDTFYQTLAMLLPLFAGSLCACCCKKMEANQEARNAVLRMSKRQYIVGNAVAVVFLTICSVLFTFLIGQLLCLVAYPFSGGETNGQPIFYEAVWYDEQNVLDMWRVRSPYLYNMIVSVYISVLAGGMALFTYGICLNKRVRKVKTFGVVIGVYLFFVILDYIGATIGIPSLCYLDYLQVSINTVREYFLFLFAIYGVAIGIIWIGKKEYEYY